MKFLNIDITFDGFFMSQHGDNPQASGSITSLAISNVHKIKELQRTYQDLRSIVLIVKKLLARYNLNKPYSGGLNSYSIVLMTSSFLSKFGINNVSALSQNLSEFFSFFGNYFDPTVLGMDGSHFFNLTIDQQQMQENMWVLDIQNRENNTAKSAFRINEIKQVFRNAFNLMMDEL
jgi:DNA polymerase sigma